MIRAILSSLILALLPLAPARAAEVTVLAAASLTDLMGALSRDFAARTDHSARLVFASSGTLARQIAAGAPADVFVSANQAWMDYLIDRDLADPASQIHPFANRLVLIAPADSTLALVDLGPDTDLSALLAPGGRMVLGDTASVPAGIYARQALSTLGLWDQASDLLAEVDDVRAALALVDRGEAGLGIVYASDASIADVRVLATFPADSHDPIAYAAARIDGGASPVGALAFLAFLDSPRAATIARRHGFGAAD